MNAAEKRQTALGAARSQSRRMGIDPLKNTYKNALDILDDIARENSDLVASNWYLNATDNQIKLFKKEWNEYRKRGY